MRRLSTLVALTAAMLAAGASTASAQLLSLTVSPSAVAIPSADPDVSPTVLSAPVSLTISGLTLRGWHLTVLASGDLVSGASTIPISNVTWTATPTSTFQNGTLNKTVAQPVGSGGVVFLNSVNGTLTFRFANSWTYDAGAYTQTIVFTLSVP
jgi:hypothetical protein